MRLSPGLVQGCFDLLVITSSNALTFPEISAAFAKIGNLPSGQVIETAQNLRWLEANEKGDAILTLAGSNVLSLESYEAMLRQTLLDYIDVEAPAWVQNATFGRARVLAFVGSEIAQVFAEAGLSHGSGDDVVKFWDSVALRARGQKDARLTEIGRAGERLTLVYEKVRTGRQPRWVSIDDNADGYDVLSVVETGDPRPLSIEVKTSTMGLAGLFHITRNEWEISEEADFHLFHLWSLPKSSPPVLAIIGPQEMREHIPENKGAGAWEIAEIPFATFQASFASPSSV